MTRRNLNYWNTIVTGVLVGLAIPIMMYGILLTLVDGIESVNLFEFSSRFRSQTLPVVALCANLIPLQVFNRKRFFASMRGIVFPTLFYAGWWMVEFGMSFI